MKRHAVIGLASFALILTVACGGHDSDGAGHQDAADAVHDAGHGYEASTEDADTTLGGAAVATIEAKNDSGLTGTASFSSADGAVTMTLSIQNATPGEHAFHLHEIGDCSAPDGTSAGGHWNPTGHDHGAWGGAAFHLGDVGNLVVGEDGTAELTVTTALWSIATGAENDVVGRAVIVHAGVDDFTTQPTGAAGGRIGCGVIQGG